MNRNAEWLDRLARRWECRACGIDQIGLAAPADPLCLECAAKLRAVATAAAPQSVDALLEAAGVPWRYRRGWNRSRWERSFGPWPDELALWLPRSEQSILLLYGDPAAGKTGLASILLEEALRRGESGAWVRAQQLFDAAVLSMEASRAADPQASRFAAERLALELRCRQVDVLVLDDLFASGSATPMARERALTVIANRYDDGLRTAITTNRSLEEINHILRNLRSRVESGIVVKLLGDTGRRPA